MAERLEQIETACAQALARIGVRMKSGVGSLALSETNTGWIGLNSGKFPEFIRINPVVGVHCPEVMKMTSAARGKKYRPMDVATFSVPLVALSPNLHPFVFKDLADIQIEAERLSKAVETYAVPYMHRLGTYAALLPLVHERVGTLGGYPQRYAALLYLSGRLGEAKDFIGRQIDSLSASGNFEVAGALRAMATQMK